MRIVIDTLYLPTGSDDELVFQTFRNYLEAICAWTTNLYPHDSGVLHGLALAVKAQAWRTRRCSPPTGGEADCAFSR